MPDDLAGSSVEATARDTATDASAAPDSGPTAEASLVAEGQSDAADAADRPTPESDEDAAEDGDDDEGQDSEATAEQTEEQKKLSRRERQRLREQERIEREVAERLAAKEREQAEAAERQKREAEAQKAAAERQQRLAAFIGEPDAPGKPGTLAQLDQEIADLNRQIRAEITDPKGADLDALSAQVAEREARRDRLRENRTMVGEIEDLVWSAFGTDFASAAAFPEFSDPADKARYLRAEGGVRGALGVLRDVVRAAVTAEKDAEIAKLKAEHDSTVKTLREEMRGWRVRAGAEEVPDTTSGGQAATSGGVLTPERYAAMSFEDRQKLRATPEGRRQIDEMSRRPGFGQRSA